MAGLVRWRRRAVDHRRRTDVGVVNRWLHFATRILLLVVRWRQDGPRAACVVLRLAKSLSGRLVRRRRRAVAVRTRIVVSVRTLYRSDLRLLQPIKRREERISLRLLVVRGELLILRRVMCRPAILVHAAVVVAVAVVLFGRAGAGCVAGGVGRVVRTHITHGRFVVYLVAAVVRASYDLERQRTGGGVAPQAERGQCREEERGKRGNERHSGRVQREKSAFEIAVGLLLGFLVSDSENWLAAAFFLARFL